MDYSDAYSSTNGEASGSQSGYSYDSYAAPEEIWDYHGYQQSNQYYLATSMYPTQETPNYDLELVIESIEDEPATSSAVASNDASQPVTDDSRESAQQPSANTYPPQTAQTANVPGTVTARRWSREYSPEERMRVGLLRFPTEQHRVEYERQQRHQRQSRQHGRRRRQS